MHKSRKNHGAYSATNKACNSRRHTVHSPKSPTILSSGEKEAMQIFNQVLANKNRILKRDSDTFYSKRTIKTLKYDSNGNEIVEKFEATTFGGFTSNGEKVAEVVQQYCNEKSEKKADPFWKPHKAGDIIGASTMKSPLFKTKSTTS